MDDVTQIKQKIDITDLIGEYVPLKKGGRNFKACCPFHGERTPSFYVSPERQVWHCFGCGKGGDIFTFFMEMEKVEFAEALRVLAGKAGVQLTQSYELTQNQKQRERLFQMNHLMVEYYHYILTKHKIGEKAREYLENRRIEKRIIDLFGLGYAPNSWESQIAFLQKKGFQKEEIEQGGFSVRSDRGSFYDRFRGRLMFPLRDQRGQTLGFSGRLLDPQAQGGKYVNSPETPIFVKGNTLFGLDVTREAIKREGKAILVEGEFDFLSSFQAGVSHVVAIKGTALTEGQILLLKRFTDTIIFALDSDVAGDQAARRGIEIADQAGMFMEAVELPFGKDPDECIRENVGLWKDAIKKAVPIYDYILSSSLKRHDPTSVEEKRRIGDEVLPMIGKIANPIIAGHYARKIAEVLGVSEETILSALEKVKKSTPYHLGSLTLENRSTKARHERLEEYAIALFLQLSDPVLVKRISESIEESDFSLPSLGKLFSFAKLGVKEDKTELPLSDSLKNVPAELSLIFQQALLLPIDEQFPQERRSSDVERLLSELTRFSLRRKIRTVTTNIRTLEEKKEEDGEKENHLTALNEELTRLTHLLAISEKIESTL